MNGQEIRKKIDENNKRIDELMTSFVLTKELRELMVKNALLRAECVHEYGENGICIYCDHKEGEE